MLDKIKRLVTWPVAFLLVGGGAVVTLAAFFLPPDKAELVIGANGFLCTLIGVAMRSPLTQGGGDGSE